MFADQTWCLTLSSRMGYVSAIHGHQLFTMAIGRPRPGVLQDYRLDGEVLLPYDLKASSAHATMLQKIGVLKAEDTRLG